MFFDIKNLDFKYKNAKTYTIDNFNLSISKGDTIAILGESGSGKSTILRLIAGLETPQNGVLSFKDKILVSDDIFVNPEKRDIGMVFQDYALFPHMTVEKNIEFGLKKLSKFEKNIRVREVLHLVEMIDFKKRYPHELSGGQQQRIALARAIAPKPKLLLLDEPFSNLDSELQIKIRSQLKEILNKADITSIFVTHDKEDAKSIADTVIVLKDGVVISKGSPKEVF